MIQISLEEYNEFKKWKIKKQYEEKELQEPVRNMTEEQWRNRFIHFIEMGHCHQPEILKSTALDHRTKKEKEIFTNPNRLCLLPTLCFVLDGSVYEKNRPNIECIHLRNGYEQSIIEGIIYAAEEILPEALYIEILVDKHVWDILQKRVQMMLKRKTVPNDRILFFPETHIVEYCVGVF